MLGGAKRVSVARHLQAAAARRGLTLDVLSYELECSVPIASVGRVIKGLRFADAGVVDDIRHVISSERSIWYCLLSTRRLRSQHLWPVRSTLLFQCRMALCAE